MLQARGLLVVVAALVVVAVGATTLNRGGALSREDYAAKLVDIYTDHAVVPTDAGGIADAGEAYDRIADDLEGVEPPADAKALHARLISSTRRLAAALRHVSSASSPADAQALAGEVTDAGRAFAAAFGDLQTQGYLEAPAG